MGVKSKTIKSHRFGQTSTQTPREFENNEFTGDSFNINTKRSSNMGIKKKPGHNMSFDMTADRSEHGDKRSNYRSQIRGDILIKDSVLSLRKQNDNNME
jgi:hypothetical protein